MQGRSKNSRGILLFSRTSCRLDTVEESGYSATSFVDRPVMTTAQYSMSQGRDLDVAESHGRQPRYVDAFEGYWKYMVRVNKVPTVQRKTAFVMRTLMMLGFHALEGGIDIDAAHWADDKRRSKPADSRGGSQAARCDERGCAVDGRACRRGKTCS
nr:hypothetical protein CFP56_56958 [Quercus suber]